jgi:hypothetical protein
MVDASLVRMSSPDRIIRFAITFVFGGLVALAIGWGIGLLFPHIRIAVFLVLLVLWFIAGVQVVLQQERDKERDAEASRRSTWDRSRLPVEFRFADEDTTLKNIEDRVGLHARTREAEDGTQIVEWDLPYGTILMSFDHAGNHAVVRNIRYFRTGQRGEQLL